jgi:hypothetical protein
VGIALNGSRILLFLTAAVLLVPAGASAQRRISADVEVKQAAGGKVATITKRVYCSRDGRTVIHFLKPQDYILLTNIKGETRMFIPSTNEVIVDNSAAMTSQDELVSVFMGGHAEDLGLGMYGYRLQGTTREDGLVKKTYVTDKAGDIPKVEIVYENFLPIYCGYVDASGRTVTKTYYSKYVPAGMMMLPTRTTSITYTSQKDSSVMRTIYSDIRVDDEDPLYEFQVPSGAKVVTSNKLQRR